MPSLIHLEAKVKSADPPEFKTNTIWRMRINSSENLELLKQSYIWSISSQLLLSICRVFQWWVRLFWPFLHIKPGKCLFLCPTQHRASSRRAKARCGAGLRLPRGHILAELAQVQLQNSGCCSFWKETFNLQTVVWGKGHCEKLVKDIIAINRGGERGKRVMTGKAHYSLFM